jgi:hypothetical protein
MGLSVPPLLRTGLVAASLLGCGAGCSSVRGTAIPTGAHRYAPYAGPVAIYAAGNAPPNTTDLGVVEVHATNQEATIDTLFPIFVQKVAQLGGNAAVLDRISARFDMVPYGHWETFYYPCGYATCSGMRYMSARDEVMVVSMHGRALRAAEAR